MKIEPIAGCPFGTPGKSRVNKGDTNLPKKPMTPARSPIFINPNHHDRIPASPNEISNAVAAELNDADMMDDQTERSPATTV